MADVFVSYAREDQAQVAALIPALEARGWTVFWDRRIPAGQTWRTTIGRQLAEAHCVIVVWSRNSIESAWVIDEADHAKVRGILVPIIIDDVAQPLGFRGIQAANLSGPRGEESESLNTFLNDVGTILAGGSIPGGDPQAPHKSITSPDRHNRKYVSWIIFITISFTILLFAGSWMWLTTDLDIKSRLRGALEKPLSAQVFQASPSAVDRDWSWDSMNDSDQFPGIESKYQYKNMREYLPEWNKYGCVSPGSYVVFFFQKAWPFRSAQLFRISLRFKHEGICPDHAHWMQAFSSIIDQDYSHYINKSHKAESLSNATKYLTNIGENTRLIGYSDQNITAIDFISLKSSFQDDLRWLIFMEDCSKRPECSGVTIAVPLQPATKQRR